MSFITIHPHKGYLNTEFRVHTNLNKIQSYEIFIKGTEDDEAPILKGLVIPNKPEQFKIANPGHYIVRFEDASIIDLIVEDGYKFGGSRFKQSFIDDVNPWIFIVMHDRTYFYNKNTGEAYVESISPDVISYISKDYVIFSNSSDNIQTLYSLDKQKPILFLSDVIFTNNEYVVWKALDSDFHEKLCIFSLITEEKVSELKFDHYVIDKDANSIYYVDDKILRQIILIENYEIVDVLEFKGNFIAFAECDTCISYDRISSTNVVYIHYYKLNKMSELAFDITIANINGKELVDVSSQRQEIYSFDLKNSGFDEAKIEANFVGLNFYPCLWDVFYTINEISIIKTKYRYNTTNTYFIRSINSTINQKINSEGGRAFIKESCFCFSSPLEVFIKGEKYRGAGYTESGKLRVFKDIIKLSHEDYVYTLSSNGYWDNKKRDDYNYSFYEKYGIVKNESTKQFISYDNSFYNDFKHEDEIANILFLDNTIFLKSGIRKPYLGGDNDIPDRLSPKANYGISLKNNKVILFTYKDGVFEKEDILQELFDTSEYRDVLFSVNGEQVMYRDNKNAIVMDIVTGHCDTYENMSYVRHINGIRPKFEKKISLQPRLINPITGSYLDCGLITQYKFVSPNNKLYADSKLSDYEEMYYKDTNEVISKEEYKQLVSSLGYELPWPKDCSNSKYKKVLERRKEFILEHFDYLNHEYNNLFKDDTSGKRWKTNVLEEHVDVFLGRVIAKKGVAVIRNICDNTEVARIPLGEPLDYINYLSFSFDSRYVALAGYRNNRNGLFLIYDLNSNEVIYKNQPRRAVWTTAFSSKGIAASYSSNPTTYLSVKDSNCAEFQEISSRSFMTFSPDGNFVALSCQGYISKYNINGDERSDWGHQLSSKVIIKSLNDLDNDIYTFEDLSDCGIEDSSTKGSVASVSFSDDNSKLMMVGGDGVIIIRNLNLDKDKY